jgi:hypothetical protein
LLRLHRILVNRMRALDSGCAQWHQVFFHALRAFIAGHQGDARCDNALLGAEVVLGVDGTGTAVSFRIGALPEPTLEGELRTEGSFNEDGASEVRKS